MDHLIKAAITAAANCGIIVEMTLSGDEESFHRAIARHANSGDGRKHTCFRLDPLLAIQGAIDGLVKKSSGTLVH